MTHARIENGSVVEHPIYNLRQRFPEASLPADLTNDANLPEGFVYVWSADAPPYNPLTHKVVDAYPLFDGSRWNQAFEVVPLPQEEAQEMASIFAANRESARKQMYQEESDPLFFKWQRGEATKEEWMAKIAEIKARFPE